MQHFFESQNLDSTPPSPTANNFPPNPTVLEKQAQDATNVQAAAEVMKRLSKEDTLVQWVKEARLNGKPARKRLKKGPGSGTRLVWSRGS